MRSSIFLTCSVVALSAVAACKSTAKKAQPTATASASAQPAAAPSAAAAKPAASAPQAAASAATGAQVEIKLASVGNQMKYNKTALTVKAGQTVHLQFHNNSKLSVLPHNWVLVKPGTEAKVAAAGMKKGKAADYLDPGPDVLAHTPLALPGKTVEVTFKAPPVGKYPYICTVPGHYVVMHGTLTVTP